MEKKSNYNTYLKGKKNICRGKLLLFSDYFLALFCVTCMSKTHIQSILIP